MVFNQQQFETAFEEVTEQLSLSGQVQGIGQPQGTSLHVVETLSSTNQRLWELLKQGATTGSVVIAAQQTAGRGQWGRQWQSNTGGLYLSLALAPNLEASNSAQLTICSAWGIATALRRYRIPVLLKWPNDLILKGRKLGGILTETRVHQGLITKAVVGVGINWSNCVPESGINLQSFYHKEELNPAVVSLEMLAAIVVQGLNLGYQHWSKAGIEILLPSYLELLESQGREVVVDGNPGVVTGVTLTGELKVGLYSTQADNSQTPAPTRRPQVDAPSVASSQSVAEQSSVVASDLRSRFPETCPKSEEYAARSQTLTEICLKPGTISLGYRR